MTNTETQTKLAPEEDLRGDQQPAEPSPEVEPNKEKAKENFSEIKLSEPTTPNGDKKAAQVIDMTTTTTTNTPTKVGNMRHVVAILALSSIILANANRQAFNQALVYMIRPNETSSSSSSVATFDDSTATTTTGEPIGLFEQQDEQDDRYDWSGQQKSTLQAAFSYGYVPFMIAGGRMSELYGAKWVVFLSGFGSAVCCLLTPLLADWSFGLLVASRALMGLSQTGVSPALYALLTRWLPPEESSVYLPMIKTGVMFGFMCGSLVNSFFTWRMTFYVVGLVGMLWSLMWAICVSSTPQEHNFISQKEKDYLRVCLKRRESAYQDSKGQTRSAPWLKIISNPVVLAFMFTKLTVKLSTDAQSMQLPMYLDNVFHVSKEVNGLLNAVNYAIQAICTGFVAYLIKEMISNQTFGLSKTAIRRLSQGINNFGMAAGYILITFNMGSFGMVACCVVGLALCSIFGAGGEAVLPIDLTNHYSASIMAIANTVANLSGIILPPMVSFLLADDNTDPIRWHLVWWFVAGLMILGGFAFCFFVEAKVQPFDERKKTLVLCDHCKQMISGLEQTVTALEMNER